MATAKVNIVLTLDDGTKIEKETRIEDLNEGKNYILESEVLMSSPPPIIRPSNPRLK